MSHLRHIRWFGGCASACAAGWVLAAHAQLGDSYYGVDTGTNGLVRIPKDTDDWTRHFRLGGMVGMNIGATFGMKGNFGISGNNPAAGIFSDGYIEKDSTGSTTATANWGYDNASQLSGNTLTMHANTGFSATGNSASDGGPFPGLDMAYGDNLWYWKHARIGWELGFNWLPIDISSSSTFAGQVSSSTYKFSTGGITVPAAPYQGSAFGYGPLIPYPNYPVNPFSSTTAAGTVSGTHSLNVSLYNLRLGPSFYWDITRQVGMSLGFGPAVGLVNGDYEYNEYVTSAGITTHNAGDISGTKLVYGGYANASLMYHLVNKGDIYISAQYEPLTDATISGGGREGTLDLGGQLYFSLGLNWPF